MTQTILIFIGLVIIVLLLRRKTREKVIGICAAAIGVDVPSFAKWLRMGKKKRERKEKILELLRSGSASIQGSSETKPFSNHEIREALKISERSVVRYLDELEKENKVEQVGATGRSVTYRLK